MKEVQEAPEYFLSFSSSQPTKDEWIVCKACTVIEKSDRARTGLHFLTLCIFIKIEQDKESYNHREMTCKVSN